MSLVCLQFGQCGNQVGCELLNSVCEDIGVASRTSSDYLHELTDKWFYLDSKGARKARSIVVDSEQKVLSSLKFSSSCSWSYNRNFTATSNIGGSGNNWALGYYDNGIELTEKILDLVDSSVEHCDRGVDSFLNILGLGGGTGSGLSCFVARFLRDRYPKVKQTAITILPFSEGDVCTQPYNTMLSISKLYDSQDAIVLVSNDYLYNVCSQVLKVKSVNVSHMNLLLAEQLACCLSVGNASTLMDHMTMHPSFRLLSLRSTPHVASSHSAFEIIPTWASMISQLKMSLVKSKLEYDFRSFSSPPSSAKKRNFQYYKCVTNLLTCRGSEFNDAQNPLENHPLNDRSIYPHWFPHTPQFLFSGNNKKFCKKDRFATLLTNCGLSHKLLEPVVNSAWTLFKNEAYLHHYFKYGLTNNEFLTSFQQFENILNNYNTLN